MKNTKNIGIIICGRYSSCGGGKCFRALREREGAFDIYDKEENVEVVGYTNCGGCPGGNIEYVPEEMKNNGVDIIHFATGLVVGYPPCPNIYKFKRFIEEKYNIQVIVGTHPIPQKYYITHTNLGTLQAKKWNELIQPTVSNEGIRISYN